MSSAQSVCSSLYRPPSPQLFAPTAIAASCASIVVTMAPCSNAVTAGLRFSVTDLSPQPSAHRLEFILLDHRHLGCDPPSFAAICVGRYHLGRVSTHALSTQSGVLVSSRHRRAGLCAVSSLQPLCSIIVNHCRVPWTAPLSVSISDPCSAIILTLPVCSSVVSTAAPTSLAPIF